MSGPWRGLEDVAVLDLTQHLVGAYGAKLQSDAGAHVVKVEPPGGSELRRRSDSGSVGTDGDPDGALFRFLAAGHESVVADLGSEEDREHVRALARRSDIVLDDRPAAQVAQQ